MAGTTIKGIIRFLAGSLTYKLFSEHNKVIADLEKLRAGACGLFGSATYDAASLVDGAGATTTVTVTGAALGDFVTAVSFGVDLQGITVTAYVSAANTVAVRLQNETGGAIDLASTTVRVRVSPFATFTGAASDMTAALIANSSGTSY
jgi:hypothetical protein